VKVSSISIESGNEIFVIENGFLIAVLEHKLIRNFLVSSEIEIGMNIEILGTRCFSSCKSLSSITFESHSRLTRIESFAFSFSSLQSILIPSNVEILGSRCFLYCLSLSSITFESNSRLTRIESEAFSYSSLQSILIPSSILYIASDAVEIGSQKWVIDGNSCPEFDRWLELKRSGIGVDFRRIQRVDSGLRCLRDYEVNISGSDERSINWKCDGVGNEIYHRVDDEFFIFVKSIPHSKSFVNSRMKTELENLINIRHPCINGPICFISRLESGIGEDLKMIGLYLEGLSLAKVISVCPIWWTSTMKAKVIAGIVLGLRFVHSLGLVHGHLTSNSIVFDLNDCIEIVDFDEMVLEDFKIEGENENENESDEETQIGGFLKAKWRPEMDIHGFALILFEILFGRPAQSETSIPTGIRNFVSMIIESGLSSASTLRYSFKDIFDILRENNFEIEDGVDSAEVWKFVRWVESAEHPER
jgi:hypothetical protein